MSRRKSNMPPLWLPLYVAEHVVDTARLSLAEHGALVRLMCSYWRSGPMRDDDEVLARIVGANAADWRKVRPAVEGFFEILDGEWIHHGLDDELEKSYAAIRRNAERTEAATRARKAKRRNEARDVQRNVVRDEERYEARGVGYATVDAENESALKPAPALGLARNVERNEERNVVPTTSMGGTPPFPPALAKEEDGFLARGAWGAFSDFTADQDEVMQ